MTVLACFFGIGGIVFNLITYTRNERKSMLLFKCISDLCWIFHYAFTGAFTGAGISAIAAMRSIVFLNNDKKWAGGKKWLWIFLGICVTNAVLTWAGPISLLPAFASFLAIISFWIGMPRLTRVMLYPQCVAMLIYDFLNNNAIAVIKDCLSIGAGLVGYFWHDRKHQSA